MIIGVPKEIKTDEYRVGLLPIGALELTRLGHQVLVERNAGIGSGISDDDYLSGGAKIVSTAAEVYGQADMIIKVKEPQPIERAMLRRGQIVFTYFHFAADREQLAKADLVVGAVLIPGAKAPRIIEAEDLKIMKPGSVIVDVAIDQGGCTATSRATTHSAPTYIVDEVVHYCVASLPGAVGRTSTFALCNVTLPWALHIVKQGINEAAAKLPPIARAVNTYKGAIINRAVAETFDMPFDPRFAA